MITFTPVGKSVINGILIDLTTPGKNVERWCLNQIYLREQKWWETNTMITFALLSKSIQNWFFDHVYRYGKGVKSPHLLQTCYPWKCLLNLLQMRTLPALLRLQNHGKFNTRARSKYEQTWANMAFAIN